MRPLNKDLPLLLLHSALLVLCKRDCTTPLFTAIFSPSVLQRCLNDLPFLLLCALLVFCIIVHHTVFALQSCKAQGERIALQRCNIAANAATLLPTSQRCCQRCNVAANVATLLPTLQRCCQRRNVAANVATLLPTLQRCCQRCNIAANVATLLPTSQCCCQRCNIAASVATLLPTLQRCCQRCNVATHTMCSPCALQHCCRVYNAFMASLCCSAMQRGAVSRCVATTFFSRLCKIEMRPLDSAIMPVHRRTDVIVTICNFCTDVTVYTYIHIYIYIYKYLKILCCLS